MSELPVGNPRVSPEVQPFFDAAAQGRLQLPVCTSCGLVIWYPRAFCPDCGTTAVTWTELSGRGTVYSYTVVHRGVGSTWRPHLPFVIAYVELAEGPRMLANLVDVAPDDVAVDLAVTAVFDHGEDGATQVRFRPA